ncbi:MAG: efflux RND transporter periplasmic adaptor subunit [Bacteroidales bacterium]
MKSKLLPVIGLLMISLFGCRHEQVNTVITSDTIAVKVMAVDYASINGQSNYVGVAEAFQSIPLTFLTAGTIEIVMVSEGETVNKGQLLAALNTASYRNILAAAMAKEKQAQDAYERLSAVYKNGSLPEVKMIEIETGLEQSKSASKLAQKNVDDCSLFAPVSGMIGTRSAEPGMNALPGSPVITLVNIDKINIKVAIPENEIASVFTGQPAIIYVPALNNAQYKGKVVQKGVIANPISHSYEIKITIENTGYRLRPGMLCNVFIGSTDAGKVLCIPQQAVMVDAAGNRFVYVADSVSSQALRRNITTGALTALGSIIITGGLEKGDQVITNGYQKINDRSSIKIIR